jgi:hypothetical protein
MPIDANNFAIVTKAARFDKFTIATHGILKSIVLTNEYINKLYDVFEKLNFKLFEILGQRNISGVIGEIFSRFFCKNVEGYCSNPHPDGRPDIFPMIDKVVCDYYTNECFQALGKKLIPIKAKFSPFIHGGFEVKCTIGNQNNNSERLKADTGKTSFEMGMPRIKYLSSINYWAHHRHSSNLLGLYYDYYSAQKNRPQVLAAFFAHLNPNDWNKVSLGSLTAKKTSNTSLNSSGIKKLYGGCLLMVKNDLYGEKFKTVGIKN